MAAKTTSKTSARERARQARARIDAEREKRDRAVEDAATAFFETVDARDLLVAQVDAKERELARSVTSLGELKEPTARIADLLGIEPREVSRLQKLGEPVRPAGALSAMAPAAFPQSTPVAFTP